MIPFDKGCLKSSHVYFFTPSADGRRTFYFPLCVGHYYCSNIYHVKRTSYNSFLILYLKTGKGYFINNNNKRYELKAGDILLVDCYLPHEYGTTEDSEIEWIHFDGAFSRRYYNIIEEKNGNIVHLRNLLSFEECLLSAIRMIKNEGKGGDAILSLYVTQLLTSLISDTVSETDKADSPGIELAKSYIRSHITEEISINKLAEVSNFSPYYFIRMFKKETGFTPHNYLINSRINIAKFLLKTTNESIKEICFHTGFQTESAFCSTFKKIAKVSPTDYRLRTDLN